MKTTEENTHGGAREGAGRPSQGLDFRVMTRLPVEVAKEVARISQCEGITISAWIRRAVENAVAADYEIELSKKVG